MQTTPSKRSARWVSVFARGEFVLAALLSIALCVGRLTVFQGDTEILWMTVRIILAPACLTAIALTLFHGNLVSRPLASTAGELAFWLVFPLMALGLLVVVGE